MTALDWAISQEHYLVADFLRHYAPDRLSEDSNGATKVSASSYKVACSTFNLDSFCDFVIIML